MNPKDYINAKGISNVSIFILLLSILSYNGCSTTRIIINKNGNSNTIKSLDTCDTFWNAIKHLNVNCTYPNIRSDEYLFLTALKEYLNGNFETAESLYSNLAQSSLDTNIIQNARTMLNIQPAHQTHGENINYVNHKFTKTSSEDINANIHIAKEVLEYPDTPDTLLFERSSFGAPIVEVNINGKSKKFWLDTGSSDLIVSSDIAEECCISTIDSSMVSVKTATSAITGFRTTVSKLSIGNYTAKNLPGIIIEGKYLNTKILYLFYRYKIDGIVGWNLIKTLCVTFNYPKSLLIIDKPKNNQNSIRNVEWLESPLLKIPNCDGDTLLFMFDTGAEFSSINQNIFHTMPNLKTKIGVVNYQGVGGKKISLGKIVDHLSLITNKVNIELHKIPILQLDVTNFIQYDGVIGNDLLRDGVLTINYQSKYFEFNICK